MTDGAGEERTKRARELIQSIQYGGGTSEEFNAHFVKEYNAGRLKAMHAAVQIYKAGTTTTSVDIKCPDQSAFENGTALASRQIYSALMESDATRGGDAYNLMRLVDAVQSSRNAAAKSGVVSDGEVTIGNLGSGQPEGFAGRAAKQCQNNYDAAQR